MFDADEPRVPSFTEEIAALFPQDTADQALARSELVALAEEYATKSIEDAQYFNVLDDPRVQEALRRVMALPENPPRENVLIALVESLK